MNAAHDPSYNLSITPPPHPFFSLPIMKAQMPRQSNAGVVRCSYYTRPAQSVTVYRSPDTFYFNEMHPFLIT